MTHYDNGWTFKFAPYCKHCQVYADFKTERRGALTVIILKCCGRIYGENK